MAKKDDQRRFFVQLSDGTKFEIGELDYNNLLGRIATGRTNGWYSQRDKLFTDSDRFGWQVAFKDIASVFSNKPERENIEVRELDVDKRRPKEVGEGDPEPPKDTKCKHDWNNPNDWQHVTTIVNGNNRYFKQCNTCGAKSMLIKKREVEIAMGNAGLTIDDVPLVE